MTFASDNLNTVLDGRLMFSLLIVIVAVSVSFVISRLALAKRKRATCLAAAESFTSEFYDKARLLLDDAYTPPLLKEVILDISLAVTYDRIGKKALDSILNTIMDIEHGRKRPKPREEFIANLNQLRSRGDLYDVFHEALGASMASLLFSHGLDHNKVIVKVINDRSNLLVLADRLDRAVEEKVAMEPSGLALA